MIKNGDSHFDRACVQASKAPVATSGEFRVALDEAAFAGADPAPAAAWIAYGTTLVAGAMGDDFRGRFPDDYALEVSARDALAQAWAEGRRREHTDAYLDKLLDIRAAGYLEEYVLATLAHPGWSLSSSELAALELDGFADWAAANLAGFTTVTLAAIEAVTPRPLPVTGGELPDPATRMPDRVDCARALPSLRAALERWHDEAALRGGACRLRALARLRSRQRARAVGACARSRAARSGRGRRRASAGRAADAAHEPLRRMTRPRERLRSTRAARRTPRRGC